MRSRLSEEDLSLTKKLLMEVEEALEVLEEVLAKPRLGRSDRYAARYAVIQVVESLAAVAALLAAARGASVEGYAESMQFLGRIGAVRGRGGGGVGEASPAEELARAQVLDCRR